ncbi:LacI family DNA-binding transcriptional regulator [Muricomes intestini]|jgi:LacI family transcriptional regulator|uniref:LacI family transcriptional regulator n=1 Tax=Muricomes intestini TaxID=1796634 RepID=A0A4V2URE8_9FIRM|nr:LacI family DNA-binding transcriptional regulator [Muricomes intestini]TCS77102.1 LacI family transcriptional regulator [Muricomes intestini]HAX51123.1 LacI family transcriptional regulator [Lachnospiraceae bacterium]HCR83768.1 LacI family transcriptional regulator [Lachnospiraceae bacterium]
MITIKDMAEMLELSTTTVSNVIHGKTKEVSGATVAKVQKLIDEYNYVPNINARNLAVNSSKIIGMAIKGSEEKYVNLIADPFYGELIGTVEHELRKAGFFMMLYISGSIEEIIRYTSTWNADGLILVGMSQDDYVKVRQRYKKPTVIIDSYISEEIARHLNVGLEDEEGAYQMTEYLIKYGHRKIGFVTDNMEGIDYYRYLGHKRAMKEYMVPAEEDQLISILPGHLEKEDTLAELMQKAKEVTAFMFCSDYYAATVINYFQDQGLKVPGDISITGFDGNRYGKMVRPVLTTVCQDVTEKGRAAVKQLVKMIENQKQEYGNIRLPVELFIGDSVKKVKDPAAS